MSGKVTVRTFFKQNTLPALIKRLELENSKANVTIGIQATEAGDKKDSRVNGMITTSLSAPKLIDVATFHEFGTVDIPQRSFIRSNDHNNFQKYKNMIEEIKDKIIFSGMKPKHGLGYLGEEIRKDIQAGVRNGLEPELKESTIKAKGSSKPLVDTKQLINAITYVVKGAK
jgi:hypothetical protein